MLTLSKDFITVFHDWEIVFIDGDSKATFHFLPEDFETPEGQFDDLVAYLMTLKEKGQEYKVLMDGREIDL